MKKRLAGLTAIILSLCMVFSGCGSSNAPSGDASANGGAAASGGSGKDNLVVAVSAEPKSLDPQGANDSDSTFVKHQMFDTLFVQDKDMNIQPGLIESWEYKDDTTLEMKVRQNVTFHNGETLTASDILYTLKRSIDSTYTSWQVDVIDIDASKVIDDSTVEVKLKQPCGPLLSQLSYLYVVNEKTVTEMGEEAFANSPVGTGPFKFKGWTRGDRIEMERFDEYWGKKPAYQDLTLRVITESSSRSIEVEAGGVDIAFKIVASDVSRLEGNQDVNLVRGPNFSINFIGFDCTKEPFNNPLVRQAISYATDKESIVKTVYAGTGKVAKGPIPSTVWGYNDSLMQYEYNPEKAKELLAEAGYPNGFSTKITTSDSQTRMDTAEILQNQLAAVGITVEVEILENATYLQKVIDGGNEIYIMGWTTDTGDGDCGLYSTFYSTQPTWSNTARYSNPEVDALLLQGKEKTDQDARMEAYKKAQELIVADAPWIFLWEGEELVCTRSNVTGLEADPSCRYQLNEVSFQ